MIRIKLDNTTTVVCLNKLYSRSSILLDIIGKIWKIILRTRVDIRAEWVPGKNNIVTNWLSRWRGDDSVSLCLEWFNFFNRFWGLFTLDCMAIPKNTKCE
jgi:hypothetical protein